MTANAKIEIICPKCGQENFLLKEPVYEGLKKTGEKLFCANCKHVFKDADQILFKENSAPAVFSDADKPETPQIFEQGENTRLCRYCAHYVVNPFVQRCSLHNREVEATDTCDDFQAKPAEPEQDKETPEDDKTAKLKKLLGEE